MTLKVLIVDDNQEKLDSVVNGLAHVLPEQSLEIAVARDAAAAKRLLKINSYDALILDVALPNQTGAEPDRQGGVNLLREVVQRSIYRKPQHVIGLTGYADIYDIAGDVFEKEMWSLLYYDRSSDIWLDQLAGKLRHIAIASAVDSRREEGAVDVCIVVAVQDELSQFINMGWTWERFDVPRDATMYFRATFEREDGRRGSAILAKGPLMGMSSASILATKMGYLFQPKCIVMGGICAGDSEQVSYGDLIVASPVWDYGSGKHVAESKGGQFEQSPFQISTSPRIRGAVERLSTHVDLLQRLHGSFPGAKPPAMLRIHIGPFASGAAVVANKKIFETIQDQQHRKLMGIDMEAYGVMAAAGELPQPAPDCLVVKGVADFADQDKDDRYRHYAAYVSAHCVKILCEKFEL